VAVAVAVCVHLKHPSIGGMGRFVERSEPCLYGAGGS
jgi:hypothetical protein